MRLNLYGGPGCRKTTGAEILAPALKAAGVSIELIQEYVKHEYVFKGRPTPVGWDQMDAFNGQQKLERGPLQSGRKNIITDSPLYMSVAYGMRCNFEGWPQLLELANLHERQFPGVHIFLDRCDIPYHADGRYEDVEGAKAMDARILDFLNQYVPNYLVYKTTELITHVPDLVAMCAK